jgi:metal-responsive CopG/Arc/MetJ family transcriptional regulator
MAVRLPQELIERIDEWMKACDARSRSDAIRQLAREDRCSQFAQVIRRFQ